MTRDVDRWFEGDRVASSRSSDRGELRKTLRALGLSPPMPVLVIIGGAGSIDESEMSRLAPLFRAGLAPLAQALGAAIVDGGTDSGVMRLIGQARTQTGGTFPLIGVTPADRVIGSGDAASPGAMKLEARHTHHILVPASSWAAGAHWLAAVASALAGNERSATVLIGGGEVTWVDAEASVKANRAVIAVRGTGGVANALASAWRGRASDAQAEAIAASGLLTVADIAAGPVAVAATIARAFEPTPGPPEGPY